LDSRLYAQKRIALRINEKNPTFELAGESKQSRQPYRPQRSFSKERTPLFTEQQQESLGQAKVA